MRKLVWLWPPLTLALAGAGLWLDLVGPDGLHPSTVALAMGMAPFATVGAVILSRQPGNLIGRLLVVTGVVGGWVVFGDTYANLRPAPPGQSGVAVVAQGSFTVTFAALMLILLYFPDGKLLSARWRALLVLLAAASAWIVVGTTLTPGPLTDYRHIRNPVGIAALDTEWLEEGGKGYLLFSGCMLLAAASLIVRYRRTRGEQRLQMKWLSVSAVLIGVAFGILTMSFDDGRASLVGTLALGFALLSLPIAVGIAILKYRLYDIDVVINKAIVYAALASMVTTVYVAVVVGVGSVLGDTDEPNMALSIAATALVAVAFEPVRAGAQHLANRIVFGARATPYEILTSLAQHMSESYPTQETIERMARALSEGTGSRVDIWLRTDAEMRPAVSWPDERDTPAPLRVAGGILPPFPRADVWLPIEHEGELLGAISATRPARPLSSNERRLAADLATQAGLVLRNLWLTTELLARIEDLRVSRQRLVQAQDAERRRLERNLHDGAQQQIVALKIKLGLARSVTQREDVRTMVTGLQEQVGLALEELRELARGIYPPLLASDGLAAALRTFTAKLPMPVELETLDLERYPEQVEASIYFCVLEAVRPLAHAGSTRPLEIVVREADQTLGFVVRGEAVEADATVRQNIEDRITVLDGRVRFEAGVIEGSLPLVVPARV